MEITRDRLVLAGVNGLKESYPDVNTVNILTDYIYSRFFISQLKELADHLPKNSAADLVRLKLIEEVESKQEKTIEDKPKKKRGKKVK
jgi:hypothetical protein